MFLVEDFGESIPPPKNTCLNLMLKFMNLGLLSNNFEENNIFLVLKNLPILVFLASKKLRKKL